MPKTVLVIWIAIQVAIGINLVMPLFICLVSSIRKRLLKHKQKPAVTNNTERDFAVIITAYQETIHLPAAVNALLRLDYKNYLIYIVADDCDTRNLFFDSSRVVLLTPPQPLKSNTRSHFYAINNFRRAHTHLTIIDSDNLVHYDYLRQMNDVFEKGFSAVQGLRAAKNLDTTLACLDAARDHYYHFYDGRMLFNAGSSATLSGSGMSFSVTLYLECLKTLDISGAGFDKVLQYEIVRRGFRIAWCEDAILYDQKTNEKDQLVKQRARWINTWFKYFGYGFQLLGKGIRERNWNKCLFGAILLRPPLFIFLLLSVVAAITDLWLQPVAFVLWVAGLLLFTIAFGIALLASAADRRIYRSLTRIPFFIFYQFVSLTKARRANNISVATRHGLNSEQAKFSRGINRVNQP